MEIFGSGMPGIRQLSGVEHLNGRPPMNGDLMNIPNGPPSLDKSELSTLGKMLSIIHADFSEAEQSEVKEFLGKLHNSIANGSIDAATLAEQAPDSLKTLAEEEGLNIESLLNSLSKMPPPPNMQRSGMMMSSEFGQFFSKIESELGEEDIAAIKNFFDSARSEFISGSLDIDALIGKAPQLLLDISESMNIDINSLLNDMLSKLAEGESD